ncbi:MAG: Calx-beta domain-containing protein [Ilumatobacteraceae bacterium]
MTIADAPVAEGDAGTSTVNVVVSITPPATGPVTIEFETVDGTAVQPGDYQASAGTVQIGTGETTAVIPITIVGDVTDMVDETFTVNVTGVTGNAVVEGTGSATVTIVDDDAPVVAASTVAFVSGLASGTTKDQPVIARLGDQGYEVTIVDDDALAPASVQGYDLIVLSSSVSLDKVGTKLTDLAVPVVSWEGYLTDELGLAAKGTETPSAYTTVDVVGSGHPVAAGLSGSTSVLSSATMMNQAAGVAPGVVVIATAERGRPRSSQPMSAPNSPPAWLRPAESFEWTYLSPPQSLANGWAIFDAAIEWATA